MNDKTNFIALIFAIVGGLLLITFMDNMINEPTTPPSNIFFLDSSNLLDSVENYSTILDSSSIYVNINDERFQRPDTFGLIIFSREEFGLEEGISTNLRYMNGLMGGNSLHPWGLTTPLDQSFNYVVRYY